MTPQRFQQIIARYASLRLAVVGDFCLDRYLEIDPARGEMSIETGLPVHNVVNVRAQPGAAGTILNNLVALGIGELVPVGFCGDDGEGFELRRALGALPGVEMEHFVTSAERRTFTYCKPLVLDPGQTPRELNRLDSKNWTPTPAAVEQRLAATVSDLAVTADAIIVMDQVDVAGTGTITGVMRETLRDVARDHPQLRIVADSRRGLKGWPPVTLKMNAAELGALTQHRGDLGAEEVKRLAAALAREHGRDVFVTMAAEGIVGADADGKVEHVRALPLRGPIDVVGAGDSVTANLAPALAAGATLREAIEMAIVASSIVVHQLGTTGTAGVKQIWELLPALAAMG
ncbi:MAG: carbohydrate kinase [Verrucomicrobia bacterium]|nr:carbohydrate kinase [Verrucomicrobiota bacterium]